MIRPEPPVAQPRGEGTLLLQDVRARGVQGINEFDLPLPDDLVEDCVERRRHQPPLICGLTVTETTPRSCSIVSTSANDLTWTASCVPVQTAARTPPPASSSSNA